MNADIQPFVQLFIKLEIIGDYDIMVIMEVTSDAYGQWMVKAYRVDYTPLHRRRQSTANLWSGVPDVTDKFLMN